VTPVDPSLLEVHDHRDEGYRPLVDFGAWRVAVLNHIDHLEPRNLKDVQRHDETDEVFVLLAGRCILFVGDGGDGGAGAIHAVDLEPGRIYNVKRGTWHTHALSRDGSVLVVENRDTTVANSPTCPLTAEQTDAIVAAARRLWGRRDDAEGDAGTANRREG
jgi:hypothetical protein